MSLALQQCGHCLDERKSRHRDFNPQVWSLLVHWREVSETVVGKPICDTCYSDLREILIERSREMEEALNSGTTMTPRPASAPPRSKPAAATGRTAVKVKAKKTVKVGRMAS